MYGGKTRESGLAKRAKGWIVASKFENVCENIYLEIWYTHDITFCCFCKCLLKVFSIMRFRMVTIILDLSFYLSSIILDLWKLSNKHTNWCLKHLEILKSSLGNLKPRVTSLRINEYQHWNAFYTPYISHALRIQNIFCFMRCDTRTGLFNFWKFRCRKRSKKGLLQLWLLRTLKI